MRLGPEIGGQAFTATEDACGDGLSAAGIGPGDGKNGGLYTSYSPMRDKTSEKVSASPWINRSCAWLALER